MAGNDAWKRKNDEVTEEDKKKISKEGLKNVFQIYKYLGPYKGYFIGGLIAMTLSTTTGMLFPALFGQLLDVSVQGGIGGQSIPGQGVGPIQKLLPQLQLGTLSEVIWAFVVILLAQGLFSFFRVFTFAQVSERTMADIRLAVYKKVISMPFSFLENRRVGELMSRISSDVTQLQDVLAFTLAEFIRQLITLVAGLGILIVIAPKLTGYMVLSFPVLVVLTLFFGKFIRKISKEASDELAGANVIVEETLQAVNIVKAFTSEYREIRRYESALRKGVNAGLRAAIYRAAFITFVIIAIFGGIIFVGVQGAQLVQRGEMGVGDLLSFVMYTIFIGMSVGGLGDIYSQLQKTMGASERVREILAETPELNPEVESKAVQRFQGNISYQEVLFQYPTRPDIAVLKGVSFSVNAGQKIGLVGHSGAGKSTIAQILMRFYPITGGSVSIDGQEIQAMDLHQLRGNIGVVPQEVILFGGSIRENIAYGKPSATMEEIEDAAKKANAWEFIEKFPEKLETMVGERGVKLSGGQRQRIAIARAILKDPAILILDEATSSLDAESESLVQSALDELMKGRTTLIIAHRLSTIRQADNILVLDEGKITESGTHEDLITKNGIYASLVKMQYEYALS